MEDMSKADGLGDLELLVMLALLRLGPQAYGVSIAREIERHGRRVVALGSVYAVLERLEGRSLVSSEIGEATPERGGRAKRYFRVTAAGRKVVRAAHDALQGMWRGIPELAGGAA
jgi:PadR family transcriptional regulator, regulatory protein PadR